MNHHLMNMLEKLATIMTEILNQTRALTLITVNSKEAIISRLSFIIERKTVPYFMIMVSRLPWDRTAFTCGSKNQIGRTMVNNDWPEKGIPKDYLLIAQELVHRKDVTERQFVDLCILAIKYIDSGQVPLFVRSDMALYVANVWLGHPNILDVSLLSDIGGQFAEWEIPGTFRIEDEVHKPPWERLKKMVNEADGRY